MTNQDTKERDRIFLKLFLKGSFSEVTDDEVAYFRSHPDQIDEVTAPVNVHKRFLWAGTLLGTACVGASKVLKFSQSVLFSEGVREFDNRYHLRGRCGLDRRRGHRLHPRHPFESAAGQRGQVAGRAPAQNR